MTRNFSRRRFLQGVGGIALATPFLSSLGKRTASAQVAPARKRLIVMFTHHGCITSRWFPQRSHGALTAQDYEATSLAHLAPYASKLLMPRGIRAMNEWPLGQETHFHTQVMGSYFTCCPVDGYSNVGSKESEGIREEVLGRPFDARPYGGRSLDHVCAEQLSPSGLPRYLAVGGVESGEMANFSYRTAGDEHARAELFAPTDSVASMFEELLGGVDPQTTLRLLRERAVLDVVRDDLQRTRAATQGTSDRRLLEAWEDLLKDASSAASNECVTDHPERLDTTSDALGTNGETRNLQDHTPALLNLTVLAAMCSNNPITFLKFPYIADFTFLPEVTLIDSDGLSHLTGSVGIGGKCRPGINESLLAIDDWYAQQFASLVGKLDSIAEGEGTLLDSCAAVWFQEVSDSGAVSLNNIPILQAGSCGGYFKTGGAINVEDGAAEIPTRSSVSLCTNSDVELTFDQLRAAATPPEVANAPINKYFCNLMNAIDVRADASGFPHRDGDAPVSHFGYYDDTTAFATFLKSDPLPPTINDPGEFVELRANA